METVRIVAVVILVITAVVMEWHAFSALLTVITKLLG